MNRETRRLIQKTMDTQRELTQSGLSRRNLLKLGVLSAGTGMLLPIKGLSLRPVVTLASVIETETARADERPLVSAVYRNRLAQGMALQADPTVVYALARVHRYDGNIHRADLQLDSPYNTYRYPGLPPGPIASPGQASLEAALAPADVRYVYFVSRNDGTHAFATTLAEHNANVRKFQVEFFRQRRLAARAARRIHMRDGVIVSDES